MKITVGTRGSSLALTQTNWVISRLKKSHPEIEFVTKIIKTTGDKIQGISLDKIGEKGLFVKEIEEQLLSKEIDMAVHSMKDMPGENPLGLMFSWTPVREDYRDALILNKGYKTLKNLPQGGVVATGSKRREYQLKQIRPDLKIVPIRGNVDTRIKKMKQNDYDGIILAASGIKRLGIFDELKESIELLDKEIMLPSPAQGALGIQIREENIELHNIIESIKDISTQIQITCERAFLKGINGDCHIPIGGLCTIIDDKIFLEGLLGDEEGRKIIRQKKSGILGEEEKIGRLLAKSIIEEMQTYER